ncbi:MAG TPA: DUF3037 domain-containing protein [Frateuria sp.]|uniref:DUF3037 domain-containing protein n=1 Tax=Frateuria sp. TaxID=2211372 RepID=UPI002D806B69|nr:DUF3037 domain-containing protein [Frateuria sp.]HET6807215.1 DUF3037 domain-containing protein [Frateuria sp.]
MPDPRRGEWVNIGVVVFLDGRLDVRLLTNYSKLRILAPMLDMGFTEDLASGWERLCDGIDSVAERQAMLATFPLVHASPLGQFIADPRGYDDQVRAIMRDLVVPPAQPREDVPATRLETQLRTIFQRSRLLGRKPSDIDRHMVVHKFPIEREAGLYADFALRNGSMRLTETIDFRVKPEQIKSIKRGQAALKAITLNRADELFKGTCVPSVVYAAEPETLELIQPSLTMLGGYAQRLYDALNPQDMADYMDMMHQAAQSPN